jgi:hypothetical protein
MEKPSFLGRIRFILADPRYTSFDRLEYLGFLLCTYGLALILLIGAIWAIAQNALETAQCILFLGVIFGLLPLFVWHRARHIGQRFVYPYRALVLGEEQAQEESRKSELVTTYTTKSIKAALSFRVALGIISGALLLLLIPFIFIAALLQLDTWIIIGIPIAFGLVTIPIGIALYRRFWKPVDEFRQEAFPESRSPDWFWFVVVALVIAIIVVLLLIVRA